MQRVRINRYQRPQSDAKFFSTGCIVLDCVLGGGYTRGRMANVVGDKSTGKTLLAIEACANFHIKYPKGLIRYAEVEAAFDKSYAEALGLPKGCVQFPDPKLDTIEQLYDDVRAFCDRCNPSSGGLYIIDSWDALSDTAEMTREIDKGTFGAAKAKQASQFFRRMTRKQEEKNVTLIVVSQVRDNIGVMFGEKHTRSGGRALDFYATHVLWLSQIGKIKATRNGVERTIGVEIKALCKKNKVSAPFRECEVPLLFYYGMNDIAASAYWLQENRFGKEAGVGDTQKAVGEWLKKVKKEGEEDDERIRLAALVRLKWSEIEQAFMPQERKYGSGWRQA